MRIAGQDRLGIRFGQLHKRADEREQRRFFLVGHPAEVKPRVHGDLVVAAACGVQLLAGVADACGERFFDERVDVLAGVVDFQPPVIQLGTDFAEAAQDRVGLGLGDDPAGCEHAHVRLRALDVLAVHP